MCAPTFCGFHEMFIAAWFPKESTLIFSQRSVELKGGYWAGSLIFSLSIKWATMYPDPSQIKHFKFKKNRPWTWKEARRNIHSRAWVGEKKGYVAGQNLDLLGANDVL